MDDDNSLTKKQKRIRTLEGPMDDHDSSLTKKKQKRKRTDMPKILAETCDSTVTCSQSHSTELKTESATQVDDKADESINEAATGSSGGLPTYDAWFENKPNNIDFDFLETDLEDCNFTLEDFEDVTRLLVELNEAWKVKAKQDPTVLPKGKTQAKYEAVTLQDEQMSDLNELEQALLFSNSDTLMGIHKSAYTEMNLDNIDDSYISHNKGGADLPHDHHQADIDNITICDKFDSYHAVPNLFNQFERFHMKGDDIVVTGEKFPSHTYTGPPPNILCLLHLYKMCLKT
nr:hypothetical protein [Tanacetum cinerariifolium]